MSHVAENELDSITRSLLLPSPVGGVYARTGLFEQIVDQTAMGSDKQSASEAWCRPVMRAGG